MTLIEQLLRIYYEEIDWHQTKLKEEEAEKYFKSLLKTGNYACCTDKEGMVIAYTEWYNVSPGQAKRLAQNKEFHIDEEDIVNGPICYIMDLWIHKDHRTKEVRRELKKKVLEQTKDCIYYMGREVKRERRMRIRRNNH